jgi:hypothetical protein
VSNKQYEVRIAPTDFGRSVHFQIASGPTVFASTTIPVDEFDQFMEAMTIAFERYNEAKSHKPSRRLNRAFGEEVDRARGADD